MNVPNPLQHTMLPGWSRRILAGLAVGALLTAGTSSSQAAVTIVDDFNTRPPAINVAPAANIPGAVFASDYAYVLPPFVNNAGTGDSLYDPKKLAVVASSAEVHGSWAVVPTVPPEGAGVGLFLAVNGSLSASDIVYQKSGLPVTPGAFYAFQLDIANLSPQAPGPASANLKMTIEFLDGAGAPIPLSGLVSAPFSPQGVATWGSVVLPFAQAPAGAVTAKITLANAQIVFDGNDFGVDNIAFTQTLPPPPPPPVCVGTGTLGYWKNHPSAWPVNAITIGGVTYTKAQAIAALGTPPKGDNTYVLFHQLVPARLNVLIGNTSTCIDPTIAAADAWLATYPLGSKVKGSSAAWTIGGPLATKLDNYNNGLLCAPHRDALNCN